jgi:hypothetical protein
MAGRAPAERCFSLLALSFSILSLFHFFSPIRGSACVLCGKLLGEMRGSGVCGDGGGGGGRGKTAAFLAAVVLCGLLLLTGGADAQATLPPTSYKTLRGE